MNKLEGDLRLNNQVGIDRFSHINTRFEDVQTWMLEINAKLYEITEDASETRRQNTNLFEEQAFTLSNIKREERLKEAALFRGAQEPSQ